jgi:hypothetical protein
MERGRAKNRETSIKDALVNLTTRGAFKLFLCAIALGAVSVAADFWLPWFPALVVALYGSCLVYAEIKGHVSLSDLTNNSPYFLGFILFLFSLFITFLRYGRQPEQMQMGFVIRELGASLLTTIVGLPFRQWLFAYDPAQQDQDLFYHALEEELRRSAGEFKKSQIELVGLVEQFVETRKTLFAEEEAASEKYISNLKRGVSVFDESFAEYPSLISSALDSCTNILGILRTKLEVLSTTITGIDASNLKQAETELQKLTEQSAALRESLGLLAQSVVGLTARAGLIPRVVAEAFNSTKTIAADSATQLRDQLSVLRKDIADIDALLTEFVKMQTVRIGK